MAALNKHGGMGPLGWADDMAGWQQGRSTSGTLDQRQHDRFTTIFHYCLQLLVTLIVQGSTRAVATACLNGPVGPRSSSTSVGSCEGPDLDQCQAQTLAILSMHYYAPYVSISCAAFNPQQLFACHCLHAIQLQQ
jgi:hypothetical protein